MVPNEENAHMITLEENTAGVQGGDGRTPKPATAEAPWELKGRGIAIFSCRLNDQPLQAVAAREGTVLITPKDALPVLTGQERRLFLSGFDERFFHQRDEVQALVNQVLLPAYRRRIPLYFFTPCPQAFFRAGELPFGDGTALAESLRELAREQVGMLLAQMCLFFPSPDTLTDAAALTEPPMTPIERMLAKAMEKRGILYEAQVPVGPYRADFVVTVEETGSRLCVEADGRDFHEAEKDALRDAALVAEHGIAEVVRFSGSQIWQDAARCAERVESRRKAIVRGETPANVPAPLPEPLPILSCEQEACLTPREGVVLTLAPAGSGKTRVLTRRVVEAVRAGVPQERILCVVFNRAAREVMEQRIHIQHGLPDVAVRTLHSIGFEVAREGIGSPYKSFKLATEQTLSGGTKRLFRDAIRADWEEQRRLGEDTPRNLYPTDDLVEAYEQYVSIFKKTLVAVGDPMEVDSVENFDVAQAARVHKAVEKRLADRRLMTFDDQIYKGVEVVLASPKARVQYQQRFDVVLVDEFQDLTPVQFLLVRLLALPFNNLFAVGDDDQMINSFAGADPRNLREFGTLFRGATVHTLGENHRCAPAIVRRSAAAISYNEERFAKNIRPAQVDGKERTESADAFRLFVGATVGEEAREAAESIRKWHAEAGVAYGDIGVLVRVKTVAAFVQIALKAAGIPFIPLERAVFFTTKPGRILGAYLRVCRDPDSAASRDLETALGTPPRYVSRDDLERVCEFGFREIRDHVAVPSHAKRNVVEFCDSVERVARYAHSTPKKSSLDVLTFLLRTFGIEEFFRKEDQNAANTGVSTASDILALVKQLATEHPDFGEFVDWYTGQEDEEQEAGKARPPQSADKEADKDKVRVLTIHSCKGDEFQAVVLFHVAEGTLPHTQSIKTGLQAAIEEERRVFYVGLTRAIDRLVVTTEKGRPSRFIKEMNEPRPAPQAFDPSRQDTGRAVESVLGAKERETAQVKEKPTSLLGAIFRFLGDLFGL
jgi:DNA helicase II / ATP-dependent DNA helicase PcrA